MKLVWTGLTAAIMAAAAVAPHAPTILGVRWG
jgi:hypothetical protein